MRESAKSPLQANAAPLAPPPRAYPRGPARVAVAVRVHAGGSRAGQQTHIHHRGQVANEHLAELAQPPMNTSGP